jgi:hypothetical protein
LVTVFESQFAVASVHRHICFEFDIDFAEPFFHLFSLREFRRHQAEPQWVAINRKRQIAKYAVRINDSFRVGVDFGEHNGKDSDAGSEADLPLDTVLLHGE